MQPSVITFTTLIGALCEKGRIDEAKDLLKQMVNKGCLPNRVTYKVFVGGLLKRNRMDEAIPLLKEMILRGFPLDPTGFSMLLQQLETEGADDVISYKAKKLRPANFRK